MGAYMAIDPISIQQLKNASEDAQNFERYVNDDIPALVQTRLGGAKPNYVKFLADRNAEFQQFLLSSGYQTIGDYAAGLQIAALNQIFRKDGEFYRASASLDLPYTTTGDWVGESSGFVAVGDAALRQELANAAPGSGSDMIAFQQSGLGSVVRSALAKMQEHVSPEDFGAIADGGYHPLSERFITLGAAQTWYPHVTSLEQSIDWAAIQAALNTGRRVVAGVGTYIITDLLYTTRMGQEFIGSGDQCTTIWNNQNDMPLFCFGDPRRSDGHTAWCGIAGMHLRGKVDGQTLWGIWAPNSPFVGGLPYPPGEVEGVSASESNFLHGKWPFDPAEWATAARGCWVRDVTISNVGGGTRLWFRPGASPSTTSSCSLASKVFATVAVQTATSIECSTSPTWIWRACCIQIRQTLSRPHAATSI